MNFKCKKTKQQQHITSCAPEDFPRNDLSDSSWSKPFLTPLFHTQCSAILISESVQIYFCPYNLQWGCRDGGRRGNLSGLLCLQLGVLPPLSPRHKSHVRRLWVSVCVRGSVLWFAEWTQQTTTGPQGRQSLAYNTLPQGSHSLFYISPPLAGLDATSY